MLKLSLQTISKFITILENIKRMIKNGTHMFQLTQINSLKISCLKQASKMLVQTLLQIIG